MQIEQLTEDLKDLTRKDLLNLILHYQKVDKRGEVNFILELIDGLDEEQFKELKQNLKINEAMLITKNYHKLKEQELQKIDEIIKEEAKGIYRARARRVR